MNSLGELTFPFFPRLSFFSFWTNRTCDRFQPECSLVIVLLWKLIVVSTIWRVTFLQHYMKSINLNLPILPSVWISSVLIPWGDNFDHQSQSNDKSQFYKKHNCSDCYKLWRVEAEIVAFQQSYLLMLCKQRKLRTRHIYVANFQILHN